MDAKRWELIQKIFEAAVDLSADDQIKFLCENCSDDEELMQEVLSLIHADDQQNSLLDKQASDLFGISTESSPIGKMIGSYNIISKIATGGMGSVYLAERADGQYQQKVALKIIKRGMDSEEILNRFRGERQILARLNHPNISRLIDGGITEEGLPWFTMEYVDGLPIDKYADKQCLTIEERLELFLTVCQTVQYAQQNLLVHRDLKPSNIMVTEEGTVKLLDFGIAKFLGESDDLDMQDLTRTGIRVMTPGYASPEQIKGEIVTTASDVYSLGVVLFRLLTGGSPYRLTGKAPLELEREICITNPKKPSDAVSETSGITNDESQKTDNIWKTRSTLPNRLRRQLSGDLDNICLMALRKEPERRYQTAGQFAEDIRRKLKELPVNARKDSTGYRVGKFITRNRYWVSAALVVVLVVSSLIVFYTIKLTQERDKAKIEASKAAEVSDFLTGLFMVADPNESKGETITARELLDRGSARIDEELIDQPETQAEMMAILGRVYTQLGMLDKADTHLTNALNIRQETKGIDEADISSSLYDLAVIAYDKGEYDRSEQLYKEALDINNKLYGEENQNVAAVLTGLGAVMKKKVILRRQLIFMKKLLR